jgi:cell wall-associated NlpC family hydrolase
MGEISAVLHTHVNYTSRASEADKVGCNATKVPWLIYSLLDDSYTIINPEYTRPPLIGRVWYHGVQDCYTLLQDYYKQELNLTLREYPRQIEWWYRGDNLYEDNFSKEGFFVVQDNTLNKHDILLMYNGASVLNHAGIYLGDNLFIHHVPNRLSSRDVYGGYWQSITRYAIRHESLK